MYVELNRDDVRLLRHIFKRFDNPIAICFDDKDNVIVTPKLYTSDTDSFKYYFKINDNKEIEEKRIPWMWI